MPPELLPDDADIRVVRQPGGSPFTLVTFGGAGKRPEGLDFWAQKPVADLGLDCIGVQAKAPNWYPGEAMRAAAPAIRARLQARSLGYGYSMGAYAAL